MPRVYHTVVALTARRVTITTILFTEGL